MENWRDTFGRFFLLIFWGDFLLLIWVVLFVGIGIGSVSDWSCWATTLYHKVGKMIDWGLICSVILYVLGFGFYRKVVSFVFKGFDNTMLLTVFLLDLVRIGKFFQVFIIFELEGMIWFDGLGFEFSWVIPSGFVGYERDLVLLWAQGIKSMM